MGVQGAKPPCRGSGDPVWGTGNPRPFAKGCLIIHQTFHLHEKVVTLPGANRSDSSRSGRVSTRGQKE